MRFLGVVSDPYSPYSSQCQTPLFMNIKSLSLKFFALVAVLSMVITSCTPDEPVDPLGPTLSVASGGVLDTASVLIGETFVVRITASQGDGLLTRLEVQENGSLLSDLDRIQFDGDPAGGNPTPLPEAAQTGFTWEVTITASNTPDETNTYTIRIVDENNNSASVSVDITTIDPGIPVDIQTMVLLLNAGGPTGTGGLDLHSGNGTGSFEATTDLRDMGIDLNLPAAQNWRQQITTDGLSTGAILRTPAAGLDYDAIAKREEIIAAFEAGATVPGASEKVAVGDLFLVFSEDASSEYSYFLLKVVEIVVTPNNNADYYEFEVKR